MDGYDQSRMLNSLTNSNISLYYYNQTGDLLRDYAFSSGSTSNPRESCAQLQQHSSHFYPNIRHSSSSSSSSYESDDGLLAETLLSFSGSVPASMLTNDNEAGPKKQRSSLEPFTSGDDDDNDKTSSSENYCLLVSKNWCFPIYNKSFRVGRGSLEPLAYSLVPSATSSMSDSESINNDELENVDINGSNSALELNRCNPDIGTGRSAAAFESHNASDVKACTKKEVPMSVYENGKDPLIKVGTSKAISRNHLKFVYNSKIEAWELFVIGKNGVLVDGLTCKPATDKIGTTSHAGIKLSTK